MKLSPLRNIFERMTVCLTIISILSLTAAGQEGGEKLNNDYFAKDRDNGLLAMVEKYHINTETSPFWKLLKTREYTYAIKEMEFILRYYSNHPKALSLLCSLSGMLKQPAYPIGFFQKAIAQYPQHAITHAQFGNYLVTINQTQTGMDQLRGALRLDPKLAVAHAWLAEALLKDGQKEPAVESARTARQLGYKEKMEGLEVTSEVPLAESGPAKP